MKKSLFTGLCLALLLSLVLCSASCSREGERVFDTENIASITFSAFAGEAEVPEEDMSEIKDWLDTFVLDKRISFLESMMGTAPGTNTCKVRIRYTDGSEIRHGLDVVTVDGKSYHVKREIPPACFNELINSIGRAY